MIVLLLYWKGIIYKKIQQHLSIQLEKFNESFLFYRFIFYATIMKFYDKCWEIKKNDRIWHPMFVFCRWKSTLLMNMIDRFSNWHIILYLQVRTLYLVASVVHYMQDWSPLLQSFTGTWWTTWQLLPRKQGSWSNWPRKKKKRQIKIIMCLCF